MEANQIDNEEIKDLEKEDLDNYHNFIQIKKKLNEDGQKDFHFKEGIVIIAGYNFSYLLTLYTLLIF